MLQIGLVGLGAGAAAALLFASVASGSVGAVLLFYLAPLPILIAALGWSHIAGLVAAASATVLIAVISGVFLAAVPVIAFGAWWLGYLTLLARVPGNGSGSELEWYPVGRLVLWTAVLGALIAAAAVLNFGTDQESLQAALRQRILRDPTLQRMVRDQGFIRVDLLVAAIPPAAAVFSTVINAINLWLAARVVRISGRLKRPWPDLPGLALPTAAAGLLAAAVLGSFLPDIAGVLSAALAASLLMAFALLGFAVLHAITRDTSSRGLVLASVYVAVFVLSGWPALLMAVLGLAETLFNIRLRVARKRGPPTLRS
jgi:hypothetical protein